MTDKDDKTDMTSGTAGAGSTGGGSAESLGASNASTSGMPDPAKPAVATTTPAKDSAFGATGSPSMTGATAGGATPTGSHAGGERTAADMARETRDAAAGRAQELQGEARSKAEEAKRYAHDVAEDRFKKGKDYASSEVEAQAERIRAAGAEWGEDSYPAQAAGYLADGLSQAAEAIRGQDLDGLMEDVTRFARRNPSVFLGGAALLGFAVARVMKASERAEYEGGYDGGYGAYGASAGRGPRYDEYGRDAFDPPAPGVANTPHDRPADRRYMS